jgi:hypothetical protein
VSQQLRELQLVTDADVPSVDRGGIPDYQAHGRGDSGGPKPRAGDRSAGAVTPAPQRGRWAHSGHESDRSAARVGGVSGLTIGEAVNIQSPMVKHAAEIGWVPFRQT